MIGIVSSGQTAQHLSSEPVPLSRALTHELTKHTSFLYGRKPPVNRENTLTLHKKALSWPGYEYRTFSVLRGQC